jgi:hypothetical protein
MLKIDGIAVTQLSKTEREEEALVEKQRAELQSRIKAKEEELKAEAEKEKLHKELEIKERLAKQREVIASP